MKPPIVFLDRDGVINEFPGIGEYVTTLDAFRLFPFAGEAVRALNEWGAKVYVVSNQGCVSRGLVTPEGLEAITRKMRDGLARQGARLDEVYYCPHQTADRCACKKPKTLLFERALGGRPADKGSVYFVGDSREDMEAAEALGCRSILVLSGRTRAEDVQALGVVPDVVKADLLEAVRWIVQRRS